MSAELVATYPFVNPVVAVLLGWWLLREGVPARTAVATAAIVAAVALIGASPKQPAAAAPELSRSDR